jgi:SAM-dependent methyltransferase
MNEKIGVSMVDYYRDNVIYARVHETIDFEHFRKYYEHLIAGNPKRILDVGCGVGRVVNRMAADGRWAVGADISEGFLTVARKGGGVFVLQPPTVLPFETACFDAVGSFLVLEHVPDPSGFVDEMVRVLKDNGKIVLACPNFLSVTNSYHWHTAGLGQKLANLSSTLRKLLRSRFAQSRMGFELMAPRLRAEAYEPDDDAICVTNPIDVICCLRQRGIEIGYYSSVCRPSSNGCVDRIRDLPVLKLLFGGVFIEGKKLV